jgi:hypothetical protein
MLHIFYMLDKKTYHVEFGLKCSYANDTIEGGTYDVTIICNRWK